MPVVEEMLRDWGPGLARGLYEDAVIHSLGGAANVFAGVDVCVNNTPLVKQTVALCADRTAFKLTTLDDDANSYRKGLTRFLNYTERNAIQWVNISRTQLTFETLS